RRIASKAARIRSRKLADTIRPRQECREKAAAPPPSPFLLVVQILLEVSCFMSGGSDRDHDPAGSRSGTLTTALVALGVVVAALLADPVADQVLGALELLRPGVAGDKTGGLPHHVALAVGFAFANEHRRGDVMVLKHLGDAAGQALAFDARQRVEHLPGLRPVPVLTLVP